MYIGNNLVIGHTTRRGILNTDHDGNVVMEQRGTEGSLTATRYVYDGRDRLRYVLPCAALDGMTGTGPWDASTPSIDQYAYVYEYDGHGRVKGRKLPGCAESHTWYDRHGRVAFEDDGNLAAAGRRRFFLYDDYNRLVVSGTCKASTAPDLTWREAKAWLFSGSNTYSGYRTDVVLDSVELHQINYYDNYTYISFGLGNEGQWLSFTPMADAASAATAKGLLTGNRTYRLGSSECEASAFYYDAKGRMVQRRSRSPHLGQEVEYTTYSFTGKPASRRHILTPPSGMEIDESYAYAYDDRTEDLLTVTHSVNRSTPVMIARYTYDALGRVATKVTGGIETTTYDYNIQSWPTKMQGPKFTELLAYNEVTNGLTPSSPQWSGRISAMRWFRGNPTIKPAYQFTYDGMGRLAEAAYTQNTYLMNRRPKYTETYSYDSMGNITALTRQGWLYNTTWGLIDDLTMAYDGNRLVKCDDDVSAQPTNNGAHHFQDLVDSAVEYEYDGNGNMVKDLNRNITSIEYNSLNLRPKAVKIGCTSKKKGKTPLYSLLSTRFALSLPEQITFYDGTKMKLTYDAAGNKLRAEYWTIGTFNPGGPIGPASIGGGAEPQGGGIVGPTLPPINQNDPQVVTDYCGNLIYRNDTLSMLLTEEGYVTFDERGEPLYHYYLKDHLGSVRVVLDGDGTVEQRNQYYPDGTLFGKQSTGGTVQPYKFGGKELERTLPLDEYDFGARWMDPVVGARFTTMDPLCEKYYSVSPYAYCKGNPMKFIDISGKRPGDFFLSMDMAAFDFGLIYNNNSIIKNREYASSIFVIYKDGQKGYTYTVPSKGTMGSSNASLPPLGIEPVAWIHTHGAAVDEDGISHNYNRFTGDDFNMTAEELRNETIITEDNADIAISNVNHQIAYLASPNGSLQKYDPNTGEVSTISIDLPSDYRDRDRKNQNNPVKNKHTHINNQLRYSLDVFFKSLAALSHSNYND